MNISHAQGQEVQVTLLYDAAGTRTSLCVGSVSLSTKKKKRIRSLPPQIFSHRLDPLKEKKNVAQRQRCVQIEQKGVASSSVT